MCNPFALKFGTCENEYNIGIKLYINSWVIAIIHKKDTNILSHLRNNGLCYTAENLYVGCLNIKPQTICGNQKNSSKETTKIWNIGD